MKPTIAITGLSGVLGSVFLSSLLANYEIADLYHAHPSVQNRRVKSVNCNLLEPESVTAALKKINPDFVIHLAAITHIDRCEADKAAGVQGEVWQVNVGGTTAVANFCADQQKFMLFLSTECVFDGEKSSFQEDDTPCPKNWYGQTKLAAEQEILMSSAPAAIIRSVVAYESTQQHHTLFSHILANLKAGKTTPLVHDQHFTPTYISDIVQISQKILSQKKQGIFHIAPSKALSPYEFGVTIAKYYQFDQSLLHPVSMVEFFGSERAQLRLKNAVLNSSWTTQQFHYQPKSIQEVLAEKSL